MADVVFPDIPRSLIERLTAFVRRLAVLWRDDSVDGRTRRAASLSVLARIFNAGIVLLTHIALARLLGSAGFGVFSLATTWVLTLLGLATLGLTMTPQRFQPEYAATGDQARLAGLYRFSHLAPLAGSLGVLAVALLILWFWPTPLAPETRLAIGVALFALPALAVVDVVEGFALANEWNDLAYGVMFILRPVLLPVLLMAAWLAGHAGVVVAVGAFVAAAWLSAAVLIVLIRRRMPAFSGRPEHEPRRWFALAVPALLADGAFLAMAYADVLVLAMSATAAEVGVYVAATKIVGLVAFIHFGLSYATAHHFAAYHAGGDRAGLLAYARKAARWTFWPALAVAIAIGISAPVILSLFGREFADGVSVVPLLLLGLVIKASMGPGEQLLMMCDRQHLVSLIYGCAALLNIALACALAPVFGAPGVAVAVLAATIASTLATMLAVRRAFGGWVSAFIPSRHAPVAPIETIA